MSILNQGLLITVFGMALVFVMILALWGIMVLLVKLTNKPEPEEQEEEKPIDESAITEPAPAIDQQGALAAAIAVAYALKSQDTSSAYAPRPDAGESKENPWLTAGRTQQLYSNTIRGRNR